MMEYWSGVSEGKGFVSNESISSPDVMKNGLMGWELKTPSSYGSNIVITGEEAIENQGFVGFGFQETMRKSWDVTNSTKDVSSCRIVGERIIRTPITSTTNAFAGEEDSSSKFSSSVVESNSRDTSLIDLKLGRFADDRDAHMLSSSMPAKRVRLGLSSQTRFCKVHGCNKDLNSSKDYHKRHKVCEIHSKSAKVIVNGIEQRFCQQCSRFHLLAEFDDGKRSCRKRLAGHNERRRKPHVGIHSARTGRLTQSYNGSAGGRFQGSTSTSSSLICQDILCDSLLHPHKYDMNDWNRCIKLEDEADYCPQSAIPITKGHLHPKSLFPHDFEKCCPPFLANGLNSATERDLNQNPQDLGPPNSVAGSLIHKTSIGNEDFIFFESASTVQGLSGTSASGCALSLLSSQSQNASSHSSGIPMAQPFIISGSHGRYSVSQNSSSQSSGIPLAQPLIVCGSQVHYNVSQSGKLLGVSPHTSTSGVSPKFNSNGMNSVEENRFCPIIISDDGDAVNFADGVFQGSQHMNGKDQLSSGDGPTIDLLQLSSQLQRVEHQRQSMQLKQENGAFCGLRIT